MNKQKALFILLAVLGLVVATVLATRGVQEDPSPGKEEAPVRVSESEALSWAATRMPQFFWISPRGEEELRIDPSPAPEGEAAVVFGILNQRAQRALKRSPLAFTYLVQSFLRPKEQLAKEKRAVVRAAVYQRQNSRWSAYALPRKRGGKEILSITLFSRDAPVVGRVINASGDRSLQAARKLIDRINLVYPPNG